jgi:hypothetical protein
LDFFLVNSRQFNTIHFLTNSPIVLCLQGFINHGKGGNFPVNAISLRGIR